MEDVIGLGVTSGLAVEREGQESFLRIQVKLMSAEPPLCTGAKLGALTGNHSYFS